MTFDPTKDITVDVDDKGHRVYSVPHGEYAKIVKDSISEMGFRLTTFELRFYRGVLAEMNTHRVFSRNSASSRAIPVRKMITQILEDPYYPQFFGANASGMQSHQEVSDTQQKKADWFKARDNAVLSAVELLYGIRVEYMSEALKLLEHPLPKDALHKQIVNRILEPFMFHKIILSGTDFSNFFDLRDHEDADPAIRQIAHLMHIAYDANIPEPLEANEWHLPLLSKDEVEEINDMSKATIISTARCARVSYLTHDGKRDYAKDEELFLKLVSGKPHLSPLEHVARPASDGDIVKGNFNGWHQLRGDLFD